MLTKKLPPHHQFSVMKNILISLFSTRYLGEPGSRSRTDSNGLESKNPILGILTTSVTQIQAREIAFLKCQLEAAGDMVCPSRATHGVSIIPVALQPLPIPQLSQWHPSRTGRMSTSQIALLQKDLQTGSFSLTKNLFDIILLTVLLMPGTPYRQISLALQQLQHLNCGCYNTISHPI